MRNVLKKMMGVKFISHFGVAAVQKGCFGRPKIQLSSKVAKFAGWVGIDPTLISSINDFFVRLLVFEI